MASKLKRAPDNEWLIGFGFEVAAIKHDDPRYVELQFYDRTAPKKRRWTITVIDREGGNCTLTGEFQTTTRDEAFRQLGAKPPYEGTSKKAA